MSRVLNVSKSAQSVVITFRRGDLCLPAGEEAPPLFVKLKINSFEVDTLKFRLFSVFRPVVILRQCWKGFQADSTAPTSQSF